MNRYIALFPIGAILLSYAAFQLPELFIPLKPYIVLLLGIVMFGMGITLTPDDFFRVFKKPVLIIIGLLLQYSLMPLIAWIISQLMDLPILLAAGLILVGACPGGTASNVICYLAEGDVALSITLTSLSTLIAIVMTPMLTWIYIGQVIDVPVKKMMIDILLVVVIPVVLGVLINFYLGKKNYLFRKIFPVFSMIAIILIIAIIMAINKVQLSTIVLPIIFAVLLHNLLGLLSGYLIPKALGYDAKICRTLAIEVGMQNSGLGVTLALKYFSAAAALPGAIFSIWHNISGAILAGIWSGKNNNN